MGFTEDGSGVNGLGFAVYLYFFYGSETINIVVGME